MCRVLVGPEDGAYASGMQTLCVFLALALGSADVYRWVDADGQAHYSDRPQRGAERITLTVTRPAASSTTSSGQAADATDNQVPEPVVGYESLTITRPAQEQTLWNIEGQLDVAAAVQPPLQPGHALQFYLDGRMAAATPGASQTRFTEVYRGEHTLQVEVVDASGRSLVSSPTLTFFVRQTSIATNTPKPPPKPTPKKAP